MDVIASCRVSPCLVLVAGKPIRKNVRYVQRLKRARDRAWSFLLDILKLQNSLGFRNFTRCTATDFEEMFLIFGEQISKEGSNFRETISPSLRLAVTLRFLACGGSFTNLVYTFSISKQAIPRSLRCRCHTHYVHFMQRVYRCMIAPILIGRP